MSNVLDYINEHEYKAASHQQLLQLLCVDGHLEMVKWIYENQIQYPWITFDKTVLLCSVISGNIELVKFILCAHPDLVDTQVPRPSSERDVNIFYSAFLCALQHGSIDICDELLRTNMTTSSEDLLIPILSEAFIIALRRGHIHICEFLLTVRQNVDVSILDYRCFSACCEDGQLEAAKWFYEKFPEVKDTLGFDVGLAYASRRNHEDMIKWMMTMKT